MPVGFIGISLFATLYWLRRLVKGRQTTMSDDEWHIHISFSIITDIIFLAAQSFLPYSLEIKLLAEMKAKILGLGRQYSTFWVPLYQGTTYSYPCLP